MNLGPLDKFSGKDSQGLVLGVGAVILTALAGGAAAWLTHSEAREVGMALESRKAKIAQVRQDLASARSKAGPPNPTGLQAVSALQERVSLAAQKWGVNVAAFNSALSVTGSQPQARVPAPAGWGTVTVDLGLDGTSRATFAFLKELPDSGLPVTIEEISMEPSQVSPNGGTRLASHVRLQLFTKTEGPKT